VYFDQVLLKAPRFEFEPPCLARLPSLAMSSDNEILAIEDKRYAAMCSGDFGALEAMLHSELLYTHSSGLTDTKRTWLASLRSGRRVQERGLWRSQGAPGGRHRIRHRPRGDRGGD
jgi:Domain of unknown function (DUF4440)